ncbi:MAG TPA: HTTM domain-containing protein [Kiritimatiellia bacterium]
MKHSGMRAARFAEYLHEPVDAASTVFFRACFGAILAFDFLRLLANGEVKTEFVDAVFHFTLLGFDWVKPWPGDGMYYEFYALFLIALCVAAGFLYRAAIVLLCLGVTHIFLIDMARFQNHSYLICLLSFLMCFMPLNRCFALDARRRNALRSGTVPRWVLWMLRLQLAIPYFYGGLAKLNWDWLSGMSLRWQLFLADYEFRAITDSMITIHLFSWGGLFFDLLVVPALLWRRTRAAAFLAACFFNVVNSQLFRIDIFPVFMLAATTIFFDPEWLRRCIHRLRRLPFAPLAAARVAGAGGLTRARRAGLALLGVYTLVQLLVPFRWVFYEGDSGWAREGHYFSWTMKLNIYMSGQTVYMLRDLQTGEQHRVDYINFLTPSQLSRLASNPERILMVAHDLAAWYRRTTGHDAAVFIHNELSMNGRYLQLSIDPSVDLAAEKRSWRPYRWILPLEAPLDMQLPLPLPDRPARPGETWSRTHMHWHNVAGSGRGLVDVPGRPTRFYECPWEIPKGGAP